MDKDRQVSVLTLALNITRKGHAQPWVKDLF